MLVWNLHDPLITKNVILYGSCPNFSYSSLIVNINIAAYVEQNTTMSKNM